MAQPSVERRRVQRVTLLRPVAGQVGSARVYLINASLHGFRVAHQAALGAKGGRCTLSFDWQGSKVTLECEVVWTALHRLAKAQSEKSIYHSGVKVVGASPTAQEALREFIEAYVTRALDEQKAN